MVCFRWATEHFLVQKPILGAMPLTLTLPLPIFLWESWNFKPMWIIRWLTSNSFLGGWSKTICLVSAFQRFVCWFMLISHRNLWLHDPIWLSTISYAHDFRIGFSLSLCLFVKGCIQNSPVTYIVDPADSGMHCQHFQKIGLTALMRMIVKYVKRTHVWSLRKPLSSGVFTSIHRLGFQPSRTSCKNAIASLKLTLTANAPEKKGMAGMLRL